MEKGKLLGILENALPDDINAEILVLTDCSKATLVHDNSIADGTEKHNMLIQTRVEHQGRVGTHISNQLTASSLGEALVKAREAAAHGQPGPLILTGATGYRDMDLIYSGTAKQDHAARAKLLGPIIDLADKVNVSIEGSLSAETGELAIVNTTGLAAWTAASLARFSLSVTSFEGFGRGYGYTCTRNAEELNLMEPFLRAASKCQASSNPRSIGAGEYTVILEQAAVADLVGILAQTAFNGRAFMEGRSPVVKVGERVFGENIDLWDDGLDPRGLAVPFDPQGVPKQRLNLVTRGVVPNIALDNSTAANLNMTGTGHASLPGKDGPMPAHIFMDSGNAMLDDMIASTRRGILVSRLRNLVVLDSRRGLVTGTTNNGTLLIENGKLTSPLPNLRFIENIVQIFNRIEMIGDETRLFGGLWGGARVPAVKVQGFSIMASNIGPV